METKSWSRRLGLLREKSGIKPADLARLCGISIDSIYSYELGRRRPSREALDRILGALGVTAREADVVRYEIGFSTVQTPLSLHAGRTDSQQYLDDVPWPQILENSSLEIVDVNNATRHLISWVDQTREERVRTTLPKASLIRIICAAGLDPRLPHIINLDEVLTHHVAFWKCLHSSQLDELPPWFDEFLDTLALMDGMRQRSGSLLARFLRIWEETMPMEPRVKHYSRFIMGPCELGYMEFQSQTTIVDEHEGVFVVDTIPVNARTWECLNAIKVGNLRTLAS